MTIWMELDERGLPVRVAKSIKELAGLCKVRPTAILLNITRAELGKDRLRYDYATVLEEDMEDIIALWNFACDYDCYIPDKELRIMWAVGMILQGS